MPMKVAAWRIPAPVLHRREPLAGGDADEAPELPVQIHADAGAEIVPVGIAAAALQAVAPSITAKVSSVSQAASGNRQACEMAP